METTNSLGAVVFLCVLIVGAFAIPVIYKWALKNRFTKLQKAAIQYDMFEYVGSVAQSKSIFNFYVNKTTKKLWYTHKRLDGSHLTESCMVPCELELNDIFTLEINRQETEVNK